MHAKLVNGEWITESCQCSIATSLTHSVESPCPDIQLTICVQRLPGPFKLGGSVAVVLTPREAQHLANRLNKLVGQHYDTEPTK